MMKPVLLKHAQRKVEAARDEHGVPHISAESWEDALYGLGYVQALDRRTQIMFARVLGWGRAAELLANTPLLVESDRFFRHAGLHLHLDREVELLEEKTRHELNVFCDGINDGLKQAKRSLAMRAAGYRPEPWTPQAVMLIGNLLAFAGLAVGQQRAERLILEMIHAGVDAERLKELYAPHLDHADFDLLRRVNIDNQMSDAALAHLPDFPRFCGSNAWAVSPRRSASGGALLASDPHLEIDRLPATWYEVVLKWPGHYLMGASLPGTTLFGVGRNRQLAWGTTYAMGDVCDFFVEDCRVQDGKCQYRRGNDWHDFVVCRELIQRKKGTTEELTIYRNSLGTLDGDPLKTGPGLYLNSAWTGHFEGGGSKAIDAWHRLLHAETVESSMQIVRDCPQPSLGWVFADRQGNIGQQVNGWFPRRPPFSSGLFPLPAWDEANHWRGWIPVDQLPSSYNPPEGFVSTANQDINTPHQPPLVTLPAGNYRQRRIVERLEELPQATLAEMQQLQYDTLSLQARDLMPVFLPCLEDGELKQRLSAWNFRFDPQSREATLFWRLYRYVLLEIVGGNPVSEGGMGIRRLIYLANQPNFSLMMVEVVDRMLRQDASRWWGNRDKAELIRRAGRRATGERDQPWGDINRLTFENRFLPSYLSRALRMRIGPHPLPGCHATVFQGHLRSGKQQTVIGPSYHFVSDLQQDAAWTNLPGGVSENRFSGLYANELPRWLIGQFKLLAPQPSTPPPTLPTGDD